jgi:hypothetical protein
MARDSILAALSAFGYTVEILGEYPDFQNGPAFGLLAKRS